MSTDGFFVQSSIPPAYKHQTATTDFIEQKKKVFVMSDCGTGKTRSCLDAIQRLGLKAIVLAPKTILEPAWKNDAATFTPGLRVSVAYAHNRTEAFECDADVYVTNHDAAKWLNDNRWVLRGKQMLIIDESTAYKTPTAQRSKAMVKIAKFFNYVVLSSGTPMPQGLLDLWNQMFLIDQGERLGNSFFKFRYAVCESVQTGPSDRMVKWVEKEGARDAVSDLIADVTIRYTLEDCIDMPERIVNTIEYPLPAKTRNQYETMVNETLLELEEGSVNATTAAVVLGKLMQIASGAVYESADKYHVLDTTRYDLIAELCVQRPHTLVLFNWRHQRDELIKALERAGIDQYAVIDGTTKNTSEIVTDFQAGQYRVLLAHPKSVSHGLTLTRATTTIWSSPTYEAERFQQANYRIYRAGQKQRTEFLLIAAADTVDQQAYARLQNKINNQGSLLEIVKTLRR